ncbi:hypothetical protein HX039_13555 [Myroides marinus]|uniref:hypothetical protein n=1 Tax=Myroides marinus TaxID=703342 RepID=UPI002576A6D3|nr:hypothetical protein [Myroides marinus]MDM1405124.1 hypothetical protein [Myroides marinus]
MIEAGVNINDNKVEKAGQSAVFMVAGELLNTGLNKVIPGLKNDLGKEIIKQGAGLKLKITENEVKKTNNQTKENN